MVPPPPPTQPPSCPQSSPHRPPARPPLSHPRVVAGQLVQGAAAGRPDLAAEGRQHRAADPAVGDHVRHGEAALPRGQRPDGHARDERRPAAAGGARPRPVRRAHEVRPVAGGGPRRRRDDAHHPADHLAVLARPAEPAQQAAGVGGAGALLDPAAALPGGALLGGGGAQPLPEAADEADGHSQPERGALAGAAQGEPRGHPAADAGSARHPGRAGRRRGGRGGADQGGDGVPAPAAPGHHAARRRVPDVSLSRSPGAGAGASRDPPTGVGGKRRVVGTVGTQRGGGGEPKGGQIGDGETGDGRRRHGGLVRRRRGGR